VKVTVDLLARDDVADLAHGIPDRDVITPAPAAPLRSRQRRGGPAILPTTQASVASRRTELGVVRA
jgi:hypothetical protein